MKKIYFSFLLVFSSAFVFSQTYLGIYGIRANNAYSLTGNESGSGFGLSLLNNPKPLGDKVDGYRILSQTGINVFCSGLGKRTIYDVPLFTPYVGLSKVSLNNVFITASAMGRFIVKNKSICSPYLDLFLGLRNTRSYNTITPYDDSYSPQGKTRQLVSLATGINYGVGAGVITSLGNFVKLDVGVSYMESQQLGKVVDLNSTTVNSTGINYLFKSPEKGVVVFQIGLQFVLNLKKYKLLAACDPKYYQKYNYTTRYWNGAGYGRYTGGYGQPNSNYSYPTNNSGVKGSYSPPSHSGNYHPAANIGGGVRGGGGRAK